MAEYFNHEHYPDPTAVIGERLGAWRKRKGRRL